MSLSVHSTRSEGVFHEAMDAELVRHCLDGVEGAWEYLYQRCHPALLRSVESLLGAGGRDSGTVDEIAARVWFALVKDDFRLLASYDVRREVHLGSFLAGLARIEVLRYFRSEHRRQAHESLGGQRSLRMRRGDVDFETVLQEFAGTLTEAEKEIFQAELGRTSISENDRFHGLSRSAVNQRRYRLRGKLRDFFEHR